MKKEFSFDGYVENFTTHKEFRDFVRELDKETKWEDHKLCNVQFVPAKLYDPDELFIGDADTLANTQVSDFPIVAELGDKPVALRAYLAKQVRQHHRDTAPILGDMALAKDWDAYCAHLNLSRSFLKRSVQVMFRGGKISGWFGQFNSNWTETMQLDRLEEELGKAFKNWSFQKGVYQHEYTKAVYALDTSISNSQFENDAVMASYAAAWKAAGMESDIREAVPFLRFTTGESGLTSITLMPYIVLANGNAFYLGPSLSVKHRGTDETVWGAFDDFTKQVAAMFQNGLKAIDALCHKTVLHPYSAMTHALKSFVGVIPVATLEQLAEDFRVFYDPDDEEMTCKAIDIYSEITEIVNAASGNLTPIRQLQAAECLGRLVAQNWDKLDDKRPVRLRSCKNEAGAEEFNPD